MNENTEYKDFSFRLSKATISDFCKSVQTAKVKEKIAGYGVDFYIAGFESVDFCIGVNSPMLPPTRKYEVLRFQFTPIGDGLRVNVHYRNLEHYRAYFAGLFAEIAKDWTETQQEINKVMAELTGRADLDTPAPTVDAVGTESKSPKDKAGTAQDETTLNNDNAIIRFGTDRDLSLADVKSIVKRCHSFSGKVAEFWREYSDNKYTLETLRKWLDDPRFTE